MPHDIDNIAQHFAEAEGARVTHAAWTESLKGLGRQASEELRLFPSLPAEDALMFQAIARSVVKSFDLWHGAPLAAAASVLLDSAEAHDDNRMLVSREALQQLATALNRPIDLGKGRITMATLAGGTFLAEMNHELARGVAMLEAGGERGEIKLKGLVKVKREGFVYSVSPDVELTGGKQEKTQFFMRAKMDGGELRPYDPKVEADARVKAEGEKRPRKARAKKEETPVTESGDGFRKGAKVRLTLSSEGNVTETTTAVVLEPDAEPGFYIVDAGQGRVRVAAEHLEAHHPVAS